ncbi:hypothetical protein OAI07_01495 [Akkermansiaceae bacterium]|nr:hypothetical protein [Akkermansiaceae bacterium]
MMIQSEDIGQQRRTFVLELVRSIPQGILETLGLTFAMYVAIRIFGAPVWMKVAIGSSAGVGLLLSLFTVQIVRRLGCSVNIASVTVWCFAAVGFFVSAMAGGSLGIYVVGVCLATVMLMASTPLISQIYRKHYANETRGKLFSIAGVVRGLATAITGVLVGAWLSERGSDYHGLFWLYGGCCIAMAVCVQMMAKVTLRKAQSMKLFDAFRHVSGDKAFKKLLVTWMILGFGNLLCYALLVEFITNPIYGFTFDAKRVAWITTTIPMIVYLLCIIPWGMVFDKLPFYRLRVLVNVFFISGALSYYLGGTYLSLCIGMALYGVGRAGGNILWNLWVTKFSTEENVGEYMSVHSFLTGVRSTLAPVISFAIVGLVGASTIAIAGASMMVLSSAMLIPELIEESRARRKLISKLD